MQARSLERFPDAEALSSSAAQRFVEIARAAIAARGQFTVALSGGSTPRILFEKLARAPLRGAVDWRRVHFFWGDERSVAPTHADSNYRMANQALLSRLTEVEARQVHRMAAERSDLDAAASDYESEIARVLGVGAIAESDSAKVVAGPPALDLILLGMGPDAHTASLFPDTEALNPTKRHVVANFVPKLDAWRMTLTPHFINAARHVIFLVAGADKATSLRRVHLDPEAGLPCQLIRPGEGTLEWMVDEAAAAEL